MRNLDNQYLRWVTPTDAEFLNSWGHADAEVPCQYTLTLDNFLVMRGALSGGTSGAVAFYLPEWARPRREYVTAVTTTGYTFDGSITVQTDGAVIPTFPPNDTPYTIPTVAATFSYIHVASTYVGYVAGTGAFGIPGGGWSNVSTEAITGYNQQWRLNVQMYHETAGGVTGSTHSAELLIPGGTQAILDAWAISSPGSSGDHAHVGTWQSASNLDTATAVYAGYKADWAGGVGNHYVRHAMLERRYTSTESQTLSTDSVHCHLAQ